MTLDHPDYQAMLAAVLADPADCLRLLEQAKRATELLGEGPTP